jgi:hypothetical protein
MVSGSLIKEARLRAGLSQAQLGLRAGVPRQQIGRWERGRVVPSFETVRKLIRACGLELTFGIANADDGGHDRALIARRLAMTPSERVEASLAEARALERAVAARRMRAEST